METREVNYVIIGAGMAGTVVSRFLNDDDVVVLDPSPGGYKIGESIIPEHFHHPVMREMLPQIKALPSYSEKWGSTFVGPQSVASFPLPPHGAEVAMHIAREELEPLMHEVWQTPIVRERVVAVDLAERAVETDQTRYRARKLIIDCSGPSMVVARRTCGVKTLSPVWSRWGYLDITAIDDDAFWRHIEEAGLDYVRYDTPKGLLLPAGEQDGWRPSKTTILTQIRPGTWMWQIPMYAEKLLSVGVVSRHGAVSEEEWRDLAISRRAAQYELAFRPEGAASWDKMHVRNGFAVLANEIATKDYVLLADACGFADPIYSVGTGLAVNKAIELAALLNESGWTDAVREQWIADYGALLERAVAGFETWYDGSMLVDDETARTVQRSFLVGTAFQVGVAHRYSQQIVDAGPPPDQLDVGGRGRHIVDADEAPLTDTVGGLLGLVVGDVLAGWRFDGAYRATGGFQLRWSHAGLPQLIINASVDPNATRYYRRLGDLSLSFMNLFEAPYPFDEKGVALFDALEGRIAPNVGAWIAFGRSL
ncbi:MAG: hypothetical protein EP329_12745 [Deltaproteobacteria bacterium]|nr:MAG: hypothetical protein EP329_12745 [Deltaproteobacteria bacterium]